MKIDRNFFLFIDALNIAAEHLIFSMSVDSFKNVRNYANAQHETAIKVSIFCEIVHLNWF